MTAQEWFKRGFDASGPDEQIRCYTEALRLDPANMKAYHNRGIARQAKGDMAAAQRDFDMANRLRN